MANLQHGDAEDGSVDPDFGALTKEELDHLQKVNEDTISDLENDIKLMNWKIMQFGPAALPNRDFQVIYRSDGTSNIEEVDSRLQQEIEDCTSRLKETMRLTGVTIENVHREVLELDDQHCKKQFSLELLLLNRKVHLTYTLEESVSVNDRASQGGKITWFEIKFEEDINEAVGVDVEKAADELAIHSVFSLLKSYLQWQTDRDQKMKRFAEMFPRNVSQLVDKDGKKYLKILNSKPEHPEFVIEWGRKTVNARVEPDLKLQVKAPSELLEMDTKKILDSAPEMFSSMMTSLGVDKAIHSLILLVTSDGQNPQQEELGEESQQEQTELS